MAKHQLSFLLGVATMCLVMTFTVGVAGDDSDIPDDYGPVEATLHKYDLPSYFLDDPEDGPLFKEIHSHIKSTLENNARKTAESGNGGDSSSPPPLQVDETIKDALTDIEYLSKMLDYTFKHFDSRRKEDPAWPFSLYLRTLTAEDTRQLEADYTEAIYTVLIMKMMEERVDLVNSNIEKILKDNPGADLSNLFGRYGKKKDMTNQLEALEILGRFLHATNKYMDEILSHVETMEKKQFMKSDDQSEPQPEETIFKPKPTPNHIPDWSFNGEKVDSEALILAVLGMVCILMVLFVILYAILRCLQHFMSLGGKNKKKEKSKYEQI